MEKRGEGLNRVGSESASLLDQIEFLERRLELTLDQNLELRMKLMSSDEANSKIGMFSQSEIEHRLESLLNENEALRLQISTIQSSEIWKVLRIIAQIIERMRLSALIKNYAKYVYSRSSKLRWLK